MSSLQGGPELAARLKALKTAFKPMGKDWATETVALMKPKVPVGKREHKGPKLRESIRVKSATMSKAVVAAYYTAYFVDAGTHYPTVKRRASKGTKAVGLGLRGTIFRKQGYRVRPRPFRVYAATEALRKRPLLQRLIRAWNEAGKNTTLRAGQ